MVSQAPCRSTVLTASPFSLFHNIWKHLSRNPGVDGVQIIKKPARENKYWPWGPRCTYIQKLNVLPSQCYKLTAPRNNIQCTLDVSVQINGLVLSHFWCGLDGYWRFRNLGGLCFFKSVIHVSFGSFIQFGYRGLHSSIEKVLITNFVVWVQRRQNCFFPFVQSMQLFSSAKIIFYYKTSFCQLLVIQTTLPALSRWLP